MRRAACLQRLLLTGRGDLWLHPAIQCWTPGAESTRSDSIGIGPTVRDWPRVLFKLECDSDVVVGVLQQPLPVLVGNSGHCASRSAFAVMEFSA